MSGVTFSHSVLGNLTLRLPPTSVSWTYNMNTKTWDTYAGQVIQLLSINFDQFVITGKFGKEGPHGRIKEGNKFIERSSTEFDNYKTKSQYGIGLTQMTAYFRDYFSIASQGNNAHLQGNYNQEPIKLTYSGALDVPIDTGKAETWTIYPTSFPSYRRSNQDFAPEWRVEAEVYEPATEIQYQSSLAAIERLRNAVGYKPLSPFTDPLGQFLPDNFDSLTAQAKLAALKKAYGKVNVKLDDVFAHYFSMLPAYTPSDLEALLNMNGSFPLAVGANK